MLILVASPLAKGLFQRAIAHSVPWNVNPLSFFRPLQEAFIAEMGCDRGAATIACLRGKTPEQMVKAEAAQPLGAASFPFHPSVDGHVLVDSPPVAFAKGAFNKVPFMTGTTEAEHSHWTQFQSLTAQAYDVRMKQLVAAQPDRIDEAKALYSVDVYGDYSAAYVAAYDDRGVTCSTLKNVASVEANNPEPTYLYRFRQVLSTDKRKGFGAYHTSDLLFLFQHLEGVHFSATDDERAVSAAMLQYWTRFAAGGDPSGGAQPPWPAFSAAGGAYQSLEPSPSTQLDLKAQECGFWWSLRPG